MTLESRIDEALRALVSRRRQLQAEAHEQIIGLAAEPDACALLAGRLEPLLEHRDPQVRGTAMIGLASACGAKALPRLEPRLADPEPGPRCDLAQAAVLVGGPGAALLRKLLGDPVEEVRFAAASGLAELGDASGFDVLIAALGWSRLRFQALSALQSLSDARAAAPVRRLFKKLFIAPFERMAAAGVLARLGDAEAQGFILERIGRRKADERGYAIELAGELKLDGATAVLARTLEDRTDLFRGAAARALGRLGDRRGAVLLERIVVDPQEDPEVRLDAAEGLMHLGTREARAALERAAAEGGAELQAVAREALASMPE